MGKQSTRENKTIYQICREGASYMLLWQGNSTYDTEADKRRLRNIWQDNKQDMDSLYWAIKKKSETETSAACGTACGASDKSEEKPAACGTACGASDK